MTEKEYRSHPAISRSELWRISESPLKFKYYKDNPPPPTPSLLFGQVLHKMVLEPESFDKQFAIMPPDIDRRTKSGKAEYDEFLSSLGERAVICEDMIVQASSMCEAIYNVPLAETLLGGEKEKVYFWTDDFTGENCKCRVDCINLNYRQPIIIDLKTTSDASTESFIKSAVTYGYDFQAAMYCEGIEKNIGKTPIFVFIAVEKDPPYAVNILQADEILIRRGRDLYREYIGIYHDCRITDNWYGYMGKFDVINTLSLPAWLAKGVE